MNVLNRLGHRPYARSHPTGNRTSSIENYLQKLKEPSHKVANGLEKGLRKLLKSKSESSNLDIHVHLNAYDAQEAELLKNRGKFNTNASDVLQSRIVLDGIVPKETASDSASDYEADPSIQGGEEIQYEERQLINQFSGDIPTANPSILHVSQHLENRIETVIENTEPLRFRVFPPLPIISAEIPQLRGTLLRFFKSYWSLIILYVTYCCAVLSELTVAHLNATYLLGFDPLEGWLFAGVIVAISYVFAKILLPQVQRLLGEDKNRLNAFWWTYIIATICLIASFGFLSYERLQDRTLTDEALVKSEEVNNLHIANDSYGGKGNSFQDLIDQKQNQLNQILSQLTQGQSTLEKWAAQIALVLAGLIGLVTSSILIGSIKIIGTTAKAYQRIKRGQKKLDKLYALDEEILGRLQKAQDILCTLGFYTVKIQVLEELLALPLSEANFTVPEGTLTEQDIADKINNIPDYDTASQGSPFDLMP